jgi:filamentous hemagglutinin family protein
MKTFAHTLLLAVLVPSLALGLPAKGNVVGGKAKITQVDGKTLRIDQSTHKAIINWKGFNIDVNELVKVNQPNAKSMILNRVTGADPSSILGKLVANGRVFLVNPNGVVFGSNSVVDVGGLLATTLNIKDADFMAGKFKFAQEPGKERSYVLNQGQIRVSDDGFVFLVAPGVRNDGLILAKLGKVVMGAGEKLTVDFMGDGLITFAVEGKVLDQIRGADGIPLDAAVANTGAIKADGGQVVLTAKASSEIFSSMVNNSGVIEARSLVNRGGIIRLEGSDPVSNTGEIGWQKNLGKVQNADGRVLNSGTLDISASEAGAAQGEVTLSGQMVGSSGAILARGADGARGGNVLLTSSEKTVVTQNGVIDTSGIGRSTAGNAVVWSDRDTVFRGQAAAKGGDLGGDGGQIEVSGRENLAFSGRVNALAPNGSLGSLLLDPRNITVANAGAATLPQVDEFSDTPATDQTIAPATINAAAANVTLQANNDITVTNAIAMTNAGVGITMQAGRDINVNASITTNNGNIVMTANDSGAVPANRSAGSGDITMAAGTALDSGTGIIDLTIGSSTTAPLSPGTISTRTLTTNGGSILLTSPNAVTLNGAINAGSGTVTIGANQDGAGSSGFAMNAGSSITTANATANAIQINVNAAGGGTGTAALRDISTGDGGTLTVTTDTGGNASGGDITQTAGTLLNVGSGTINLGTAPISGANIGSSGANLLTTAGTITASTGTGGIFIRETDGADFTANTPAAAGAINLTSSAGGLSIAGPTSAGTGAITLTAEAVNINNTLSSTGALTINPVNAAGNLTVSSSSANNLTDGFSSITIGNSAGTGAVTVNALTVRDALTIRSPTTTGTVTVNGPIASLGNGSVTLTGGTGTTPIMLNAGITTAGNAITLNDNVGLGANISLDTTNSGGSPAGATISITGAVDADLAANNRTLTLNSGTGGNTTLSGAVGSGQALQNLTVTNSNALTVSGVATASDIQLNAQNAVTLNGAINAGFGAVTIGANQNGAGGEDFIMNASSSITTTNATANAVEINVNAAGGGTGDAFLGNITTGFGGTLTVATNSGNNTAGDDITQTAGTLLNVGSGSIVLTTPSNSGSSIGTAGTPLSTTAGNITANAGTIGVFITESDGATIAASASGTAPINIGSMAGNLIIDTISTSGGAVNLTAAAGAIHDGNGVANNITAVSLSASSSSGIDLDTTISNLSSADVTGMGNIAIRNSGALVSTSAAAANGDINISNNSGDLTIGALAALTGGIHLTANAGSIFDGNGAAVNLSAGSDSSLRGLSGVVGLATDAIEVDISGGTLGVAAAGTAAGVSVNIDGSVLPSDTLAILNAPPGQVIFNGRVLFPLRQFSILPDDLGRATTDLEPRRVSEAGFFSELLLRLVGDVDVERENDYCLPTTAEEETLCRQLKVE